MLEFILICLYLRRINHDIEHMKKASICIGLCVCLLVCISCGSQDGKQTENTSEKKENVSVKESAELETTEFISVEKEIVGRFMMVNLSTGGAYISVEDKEGNDYVFLENTDCTGYKFLQDYPINEPLEELENSWYNIRYENRMIEYVSGATGELETCEELVMLEVVPLDNMKKSGVEGTMKTTDFEHLDLSGTEPFWTIELHKAYAFYQDPSFQDFRLNYLYPHDDAPCSLFEALEEHKDGSVILRIQHEESEAIENLQIINNSCNDGMSDEEYPYSVIYTTAAAGNSLQGCGKTRN